MGADTATLVWSLCSGTAPGDLWSLITLADKTELPGAPAGIAHLHISANVERLAWLTAFAILATARGWEVLHQRSTTPFGAWITKFPAAVASGRSGRR